MHTSIVKHFKAWLPLGIAITGICALILVVTQQNYRMSLNDPQIQIAQDSGQLLSAGADVKTVVPPNALDIGESLGTYISVYSDDGKLAASSGLLHGQPVSPPQGVFEVARTMGQNRVTWQPEPSVRSAIVVTHFIGTQSGFVLVGRNMREVESRIETMTDQVALAWLILLLASFGAKWFARRPS